MNNFCNDIYETVNNNPKYYNAYIEDKFFASVLDFIAKHLNINIIVNTIYCFCMFVENAVRFFLEAIGTVLKDNKVINKGGIIIA